MIDKNNLIAELPLKDFIKIELGCGNFKRITDAIGIDIIDMPSVDVIADLNLGLSFIPDNSINEVYSFHFLEHIQNLELLMKEIYRILKPNGHFYGTVPHFSNPYFYSDYTHLRTFGLYSFNYFTKQGDYFKRNTPTFYNDISFTLNNIKLIFKSPFRNRNLIKRLFNKIINANKYIKEFYEENLCYVFPAYEIKFDIMKIAKYQTQ